MVAEEGDPALDAFLGFIEADIKMHPEGLQALNGGLHDRLKALLETPMLFLTRHCQTRTNDWQCRAPGSAARR